MMTYLKRQKLF